MRRVFVALAAVAVLVAGCGGNRSDSGKSLANDFAKASQEFTGRFDATGCRIVEANTVLRKGVDGRKMAAGIAAVEKHNPGVYIGVYTGPSKITLVALQCPR